MARVTEPLASSSLKVLSFESTLYVLMDGRWRYHERDKSHLGGPAYTGNCFVFSHTFSRSRIRHRYIYRRLRRSRTRKFSQQNHTFSPISCRQKYILHESSNLFLRVSGVVSYRILQDVYMHQQQTTQKSKRRLKDVQRILRRHLNACIVRVFVYSVYTSMYVYVCVFLSVNTVYRAPARISRARVSYCINISSVKFVHFSRSQ